MNKSLADLADTYSTFILADTSWILYRGFHAFENLSTKINGVDVPTGHVYHACQLAASLSRVMGACTLWAVDNVPVEKIQANPAYKANRDHQEGTADNIHGFAMDLPGLFACMPQMYHMAAPNREADDVIGAVAKQLAQLGKRVIVFSADDDMSQLLQYHPLVDIATNFKKPSADKDPVFEFRPSDYVEKKYGVSPHELPTFRTLRGDSSDNLPGIPRFPTELARHVAKVCPDFNTFPEAFSYLMSTCRSQSQQRYIMQVRAKFSTLRTNFDLFHSMHLLNEETVPTTFYKGDPDSSATIANLYGLSAKSQKSIRIS